MNLRRRSLGVPRFPTQGVGPILREVTVVRLSNGKSKRYPAGYGKAWTAAIEEDLLSLSFE